MIRRTLEKHRSGLIAEAKNRGKPISLGVDGQCDSPGFNATYCTVTSMDVETNKILDFKVVNVKECKNSQG